MGVHTFSPHIEIWIVTEGSVVGREGGGGVSPKDVLHKALLPVY